MLTRKQQPFIFGPDQLVAQEDLKQAVLTSPALRPIDYTSTTPVILSVDTSHIAVGYILSQIDQNDNTRCYFARFGLIMLNDRESCFSQPKLEIYGLFRALRVLKLYLIGIRNLFYKNVRHRRTRFFECQSGVLDGQRVSVSHRADS